MHAACDCDNRVIHREHLGLPKFLHIGTGPKSIALFIIRRNFGVVARVQNISPVPVTNLCRCETLDPARWIDSAAFASDRQRLEWHTRLALHWA